MIEITGPRLTLRTMTREEFHAVRRVYVPDPAMDTAYYVYCEKSTDETYDRYAREDVFQPTVGIFLPDGTAIGELKFKRINRVKRRCELGIVLANDTFKGHGYGREAFGMALAYAFTEMGMESVYADTMGGNIRMQRILEGLGFRCYLRLEDCYNMDGRWEDRLDYVIAKADWQK